MDTEILAVTTVNQKHEDRPSSPISKSEVRDPRSSVSSLGKSEHNFMVSFSLNDQRNPIHFCKRKKWIITVVISFFTVLVSASATSFSIGNPSMIRELNCTPLQATLGLSLYCLGFGVVPLLTSAFGEEFGRLPLYYVSIAVFLLMHVVTALSRNIQSIIISRVVQGAFGSTAVTMVAGTIADIWSPHERGLPMSLYSFLAISGNGLGALVGGWIENNKKLEWRWIQWISLIIGGVYAIVMILMMDETRSSVILEKQARKLRETTGDPRYHSALSVNRPCMREMIYISCTRPVSLLFCEPILFTFSAWIGFAWGVYFCMIESIPGVFISLHGFNQGQVGSVFMTMALGSVLGFFTNMVQEKLYQKNVASRGPQARLYFACLAGFIFPVSVFMFAWSSTSQVPWAVLVVALTIFVWAVFTIYLAVFTYLADCYGTYASSALAGQSLFRNLMAVAFPLFADKMFKGLGYRWANTLFGCAALAMSPIPIVLLFFGHKILAKSPVVRRLNDSR